MLTKNLSLKKNANSRFDCSIEGIFVLFPHEQSAISVFDQTTCTCTYMQNACFSFCGKPKSFVCGKSSMEREKLLTASILSRSSLALPLETHSLHLLPDTELLFMTISTPLLFIRLYKEIRWSTTCTFRQ